MKKILMVVFSLCVAGVLFAEVPTRPTHEQMQRSVDSQLVKENFKKAYYDYMDLVMYTYNPPATVQKERSLRLSQAYMQIPTGERISSISRYFQGKWVIGGQVVAVRDLLNAQAANIPAAQQASYVAFLEQVDKDIAAYSGRCRPEPYER